MAPTARAMTPAMAALRTQTLSGSRAALVCSSRSYASAKRPSEDPLSKIPDPSNRLVGKDRPHVNEINEKEGHTHDVQSKEALAGKQERASGSGNSGATSQKGGAYFADKAKKEHPKAPEPIIGMNDERGAKGH